MNNNFEESLVLALLMGYDETVYNKYKDDFDKMKERFISLSNMIIKDDEKDIYKYFCDFKSFFLFYDTFLLSKKCNAERLIYLLTDSFNEVAFLENDNKNFVILDDALKYKNATKEALNFIRSYTKLDAKIKDEMKYDVRKKMMYSYNAYKSDNKVLCDDDVFLKPKFGNKFINRYKHTIGKNFL